MLLGLRVWVQAQVGNLASSLSLLLCEVSGLHMPTQRRGASTRDLHLNS